MHGSVSALDDLTRDILRDEVRLQQFNLTYRLNAIKGSHRRSWRYFAFQEAALDLFLADTISIVACRGAHLRDVESMHPGAAAAATALPMFLGFLACGTGDAVELSANIYNSLRRWRTDYSQAGSLRHVRESLSLIDAKLKQRRAMLEQDGGRSPEAKRLQDMEGRLLEDFREMAGAEFARFHAYASRFRAIENTFFTADIGKAATGAVWTGLAMHSIRHDKPRMDTAIGIIDTINASQTMIDPPLAHLAGALAVKHDRAVLKQNGIPDTGVTNEHLASDYSAFSKMVKEYGDLESPEFVSLISRMEHYEANVNYYDRQIRYYSVELARARAQVLDQLGWGLFVGSSKMPLAVMDTISGVRYPGREGTLNEFYFAGALAYMPSLSVAIVNSWRRQIKAEVMYRRLRKQGKVPGQLLLDRLNELDSFSRRLGGGEN